MTETTLFMDHFYILDDGRVRQFLIAGERTRRQDWMRLKKCCMRSGKIIRIRTRK